MRTVDQTGDSRLGGGGSAVDGSVSLRRLWRGRSAMLDLAALRAAASVILIATATSIAVLCVLYPEMRSFRVSQIRFSEYGILYSGTHHLLADLSNGTVSLWNPYDQLPLGYHILAAGLNLSFTKLLVIGAYLLCSPFMASSAITFHRVFSVAYVVSVLLLQTTGAYLLIRRFSRHRALLVFVLVLLNVVLSSSLLLGTGAGDTHVYIPFIMAFVLDFSERPSAARLTRLVLMGAITVYTIPFIAVQYVYQYLHIFLLAVVAVTAPRWFPALLHGIQGPRVIVGGLRKDLARYLVVALLAAAIVLPLAVLAKTSYSDYDFGPETTRFANPLSVKEYFNRPICFAPKKHIFENAANYLHSEEWADNWQFTGLLLVALVSVGIVSSRDRRKWIFAGTFGLLFLLNSPRDPFSMWSVGHWVNALTNPLKFTTRSFHMAGALTLPYTLIPIATMGLERARSVVERGRGMGGGRALLVVAGVTPFLLPLLGMRRRGGVALVDLYLILSAFALVGLLFVIGDTHARGMVRSRPYMAAAILLIWLGGDAIAAQRYMRPTLRSFLVRGEQVGGCGPVKTLPDYQNPEIHPFRYHFRNTPVDKIEGYWETEVLNMYGLFSRYTNLDKYLNTPSKWLPVHRSYRPLSEDPVMRDYLRFDSRLFFFARYSLSTPGGSGENTAENVEQDILGKILLNGIGRDVILVRGKEKAMLDNSRVSEVLRQARATKHSATVPDWAFENLDLRDAHKKERYGDIALFEFLLPD